MIELKDAPKIGNGNLSRTIAPMDTYHRIHPLMPNAGLSYVLEITALDTLGIPIYVGFGSIEVDKRLRYFTERAPKDIRKKLEQVMASAETFLSDDFPDGRESIFAAGKGPTSLEAKVSAMMEAIERFSARRPSSSPVVASYNEMLRKGDKDVLDPRSLVLQSPAAFDENQKLEWVTGTELKCKKEIWVPADAATFSYQPRQAPRICSDTPTGLGAGNTIEEAISHGLAEAIEHDSWTLAVVRSSVSSAQKGILDILFGETDSNQPVPPILEKTDGAAFVRLDMDSLEGFQPLAKVVGRIRRAGIRVNVYWVTTDLGIPTFSVAMAGLVKGKDGGGLGTHPDARIALTRALTEAAQQRLILGASSYLQQVQLLSYWQSIPWEKTADRESTCELKDVESFSYSNILEDIRHMMQKLTNQGLEQVIIVDLTKPEFNIPVVKVIVPGLADYWTSNTAPNWNALGPRVKRYVQ